MKSHAIPHRILNFFKHLKKSIAWGFVDTLIIKNAVILSYMNVKTQTLADIKMFYRKIFWNGNK